MGRAPCCDKANVKKGPWSPEEDAKLKSHIEQNGTGGNWIALPQKIGLKRCGKSCRLRWLNYLRPNIKHGGFSEEEDNIICSLYISIGSRWSIIAAQLPGRTDNDIKNYWNTRLKKKLLGKQRKVQQIRRANIRREIKKETPNFMAPVDVINHQQTHHHYWPELPSSSSPSLVMPAINNPTSLNQDSHFLDQESLRNLLIKIGGRFSDDDNNNDNNNNQDSTNVCNYPIDGSCITQDQPYSNMVSSSTAATVVNGAAGPNLFESLDGFPVEFDELIYSNNQQQLQGLGSFYGSMEMGNGGNGAISSGESSSWGNVSSLAYPQLVSEFENCLQSLPRDHSSLEVSSYFGPQ